MLLFFSKHMLFVWAIHARENAQSCRLRLFFGQFVLNLVIFFPDICQKFQKPFMLVDAQAERGKAKPQRKKTSRLSHHLLE